MMMRCAVEGMMKRSSPTVIEINRAPVLTLWASVVAERLGFKHAEALTLAKAVAGLNAQSKGKRLGIYEPSEKPATKPQGKVEKPVVEELMGRAIPVQKANEGVRALVKGSPINPASVERYLEGKFGDHLDAARQAMVKLAGKFPPKELAARAYELYEQFRPEIPSGVRGWGATGKLDLGMIESMGKG
jgi:hypothetical protein